MRKYYLSLFIALTILLGWQGIVLPQAGSGIGTVYQTYKERSAVAPTPPATYDRLYFKSDGLHYVDSSGADHTIVNSTGGTVSPTILTIAEKTPVNAVAATGTLTVTGGGTQIAAGYIVHIDTKNYTFVTPVGTTEGNVLVGVNDTASLLNLLNAIKHTGTPGTDYYCAAEHPTVSGTSSDATTIVITAKTKGVSTIATTKTGAEISWAHTTLYAGVDGTVGVANEICADGTNIYHAISQNTISDANWRKVSLGSAY